VSYKPERKYIAEIKGLTNSLYFQTGGNWFHGYEPYEQTPGGVAEQPDSFEILRNDFVINFDNPAGSSWKYSGKLSESGTYHFKYDAIIDAADTTEFEKFCIRVFSSSTAYTPSPGEPIGNSPYNNATAFSLREDIIRKYTDVTVNGNDCRYVTLEFTLDYDSTATGLKHGLFAMWTSNSSTKHVTEWIHQRIEITKL
jgi:hypothetical protein